MTKGRFIARLLCLAAVWGVAGITPARAQSETAPSTSAKRPETYGTAHLSYIQVPGSAFVPQNNTNTYATTNNGYGGQVLRIVAGGPWYFSAPISLPSGAAIKSYSLDYCDDTAAIYIQGTLVKTDLVGNAINAPFIQSDGNGCKSKSLDISASNFVADNATTHYSLVVVISASSGHTIGLAGMTVGYQLQVSPGPATATFTDVPVSSGLFKFVEALVAAGITAGCGGGNFCPNNPITRGQMAVFLASALGLQFQ